MKVACLLAPHLPVQVERQHEPSLAHVPLVVGGRPWDPGAVLDCCPLAEAAGVSPGLRLSQAEALCPAARFVPAREELYRAVHEALLAAAGLFTPTVETAGLGFLYAEVSGLERSFDPAQDKRFDSDTPLARCMAWEAERTSGQDVRVGVGSSKFVAEQAARAARPGSGCAVPGGQERAFLSPLPLSTLPADPEMHRRLHLLGVRTLGALAALPRLAVVHQFGPHAGPVHDLACGVDPRPVHPAAPPLVLERSCAFPDPLGDRAPLLAHAGRLATALAAEALRLQLDEENWARPSWHCSPIPPIPAAPGCTRRCGGCGSALGR